MRIFKVIPAVAMVLLGLLWALQGADLVHVEPLLCFANCEPMVGGSLVWLIVGLLVLAFGIWLLMRLWRSRHAQRRA